MKYSKCRSAATIVFPSYLNNLSILLILVLLILPIRSVAKPLNEWGIKLGASISNQNYNLKTLEMDRDFDHYLGLNIDVFGNLFVGKSYDILAQFAYSQKGSIETITPAYVDPDKDGYVTGKPIDYENRTDYVSLFLLGKLHLNAGMVNPYIILGPRIDFLIYAKSTTIPKADDLNKAIFGFSIGIGSEFSFFIPYKTLIEFQYSPDFTKMYDNDFISLEKVSYEIKLGIIF